MADLGLVPHEEMQIMSFIESPDKGPQNGEIDPRNGNRRHLSSRQSMFVADDSQFRKLRSRDG